MFVSLVATTQPSFGRKTIYLMLMRLIMRFLFFIVFYDFASDCTNFTQGVKFAFLHKDNKSWNSGKALAAR